MEDACIHSPDIGDQHALFGVFDGHGGNSLLTQVTKLVVLSARSSKNNSKTIRTSRLKSTNKPQTKCSRESMKSSRASRDSRNSTKLDLDHRPTIPTSPKMNDSSSEVQQDALLTSYSSPPSFMQLLTLVTRDLYFATMVKQSTSQKTINRSRHRKKKE